MAAAAAPAPTAADVALEKPKIDPSKDLWQNITANVKDAGSEQVDQNVLIVGSRGSGKSTLVSRMLGSSSSAAPKPTTALEYSYGKREERNTTQIAHFWELAQGNELAALSDVVLSPEAIHTVVVCIVLDCGDLTSMWDTLTYWLKRIDRRLQDIFARMKAKNSSTPDKMLQRHRRRIGEDHPDLAALRLTGLPVVIIASRMDMLKEDTMKTKTLMRSLRYVAHVYGASLIVTSAQQEREASKLRALLNHHIFGVPFEQRLTQMDYEKGGLLIPCGKDSFSDIGIPTPTSAPGFKPSGDAELDKWKAPFDEAFPPKVVKERSHIDDEFVALLFDADKGAAEPAVDAMLKQKEEELELYRKSAAKKSAQLASASENATTTAQS
mgnify:FL=1